MNKKSKRKIHVFNNDMELLATGVYYRDGNVQINWRIDIGFTSEQYNRADLLFNIVKEANIIKIGEEV